MPHVHIQAEEGIGEGGTPLTKSYKPPQSLKEEEEDEEDEIDKSTAAVVVPPDSGWAWVVMVASFLCCTVVDGIVFSSGLIQPALIKEFGDSEGYVAFVSSLLSGFYLMAGPFVSALANRFGFRAVTICGGIIASSAFMLCYYAINVEYLFLVYGVIGGIGFCMIYIPSVVIIGFYFEKWRALATGVALCGSGVGTFTFGPLTNYLLLNYGWRNTMVAQAGCILCCAIFGLAFRPIQPITITTVAGEVDEKTLAVLDDEQQKKLNGHGGYGHVVAPTKTNEYGMRKLPEGRFAYSMPNSAHNTYMGASPKHQYPTAAEVFKNANLDRRLSNSSTKGGTELKVLRKSQPTTPNGEPMNAQTQLAYNLNKELSTVGENENEDEPENENLLTDEPKPIIVQARRHTVSGRRPQEIGIKKIYLPGQENHHHTITAASRPMYRDDVFFTGSLTRIAQYQSQTSLAYHMSVTRLPTKHDVMQERQGCRCCPESVSRILLTMLDVSLLKSPSFMLLAFSGFLTMMGFFVPFTFLTRRAVLGGMDESVALKVFSGIGIVNTLARVVCGTVSSFPKVKPLWLNNIAITVGGLATIFSGVIITPLTQWTFAVLFGICIACFSALRSLIAVEMIGLEKLTNAFGFLMLFQGLAATVGTPIAGMLYSMTGSYDVSFYFAGGLILLSAFLCYPLTCVGNWEKRRNEENNLNAFTPQA